MFICKKLLSFISLCFVFLLAVSFEFSPTNHQTAFQLSSVEESLSLKLFNVSVRFMSNSAKATGKGFCTDKGFKDLCSIQKDIIEDVCNSSIDELCIPKFSEEAVTVIQNDYQKCIKKHPNRFQIVPSGTIDRCKLNIKEKIQKVAFIRPASQTQYLAQIQTARTPTPTPSLQLNLSPEESAKTPPDDCMKSPSSRNFSLPDKWSMACFKQLGLKLSNQEVDSATLYKCSSDCSEKLVKKYLVETEDSSYLKFKNECAEAKIEATECCSNPNKCDGLALDLTKSLGPLTPAIYAIYEGIKSSNKISGSEMTQNEITNRICDSNNKVAMGGFLSELGLQLAPMLEKTCKQKISQCQDDCNDKIEDFKRDFRACFAHLAGTDNELGIVNYAVCKLKNPPDLDNSKDEINSVLREFSVTTQVEALELAKKVQGSDERIHDTNTFKRTAIANLLLLAKAYSQSSNIKQNQIGIKGLNGSRSILLSKNSDEKQVVDCNLQKDRVAREKHRPGYIPAPALQMCHQVVDNVVQNPGAFTATTTVPPKSNASLVGNTYDKKKSHPGWMYPADGKYGLGNVPPEDEFGEPTGPALSYNVPAWSESYGSGGLGSFGGPGGSMGGSGFGSGGYNDSAGGMGDYPSYSDFAGMDSAGFSGGEEAPYMGFGEGGAMAGGSFGGPGLASNGPGAPSDRLPNAYGDMPPGDYSSGSAEDGDIFQTASQVIQQFCANNSCVE